MSLDRVAVDLERLGCLNDIAFVNHEPMQKIMPVEILWKKTTFPQMIQGFKSLGEFWS